MESSLYGSTLLTFPTLESKYILERLCQQDLKTPINIDLGREHVVNRFWLL